MEERRRMLAELLRLQGVIRSEKVMQAFLKVPREEFVLPEYRDEAYEDHPLPILKGQTISAPHMCAIMCEAAEIERGDTVLEVGTGSGYQAALCAEIVSPTGEPLEGVVLTVEVVAELARFARDNLKRTKYYDRVHLVVADGSCGSPVRENFRFKRILVTAAAPTIPPPLIEQLDENGSLVIPVGPRWHQLLVAVRKKREGLVREPITYCIFVALRGKYGYDDCN
ncbi:MAG: protein-L-isoaspartate(D-aspartate) O-methyltransferase [Thermofilaceae archaeon]